VASCWDFGRLVSCEGTRALSVRTRRFWPASVSRGRRMCVALKGARAAAGARVTVCPARRRPAGRPPRWARGARVARRVAGPLALGLRNPTVLYNASRMPGSGIPSCALNASAAPARCGRPVAVDQRAARTHSHNHMHAYAHTTRHSLWLARSPRVYSHASESKVRERLPVMLQCTDTKALSPRHAAAVCPR